MVKADPEGETDLRVADFRNPAPMEGHSRQAGPRDVWGDSVFLFKTLSVHKAVNSD
jgi:hypothetical protein